MTPEALRPVDIGRLLALARRRHMTQPTDAAGRCLAASLDLVLAARRHLGFDLWLVKWRVVGDPSYADHWAVALDDVNVVDLTRVQVDGRPQLIARLDSYPANFTEIRFYPASLLLRPDAASPRSGDQRLPHRFLWFCGTRLFRFDAAAAVRGRQVGAGLIALREFARFLMRFGARTLIRALEKRVATLQGRLPQSAASTARPANGRHSGARSCNGLTAERASRGQGITKSILIRQPQENP